MLVALVSAIAGGLVTSAASALVAFRQGKQAAEDEHDRDVEERLRDCEFELTEIRATLRERRNRR